MSGPGYPRRVRLSCLTPPAAASVRRQTQEFSRPTLRMHFEHFRCEMPGFCNATQCLHQVSKLTAGRYHLATAFTYQGTIEVRRTMSLIGHEPDMPQQSLYVRCRGQRGRHLLLASISPFDPLRTPSPQLKPFGQATRGDLICFPGIPAIAVRWPTAAPRIMRDRPPRNVPTPRNRGR